MRRIVKRPFIFVLVATLVFIPFGTSALAGAHTNKDEISGAAMAADFLFARPVGIVSVVAGTALFIVSLPFSAMGGNVDNALQALVTKPIDFTFKRPLGDF